MPDRLLRSAWLPALVVVNALLFGAALWLEHARFASTPLPALQFVLHWVEAATLTVLVLTFLETFLREPARRRAEARRGEALRQRLEADFVAKGEQLVQQERRRETEVLGTSLEQFRALAEQSGGGLAVLTADGTFHYLSPSAAAVLGYSRPELLGHSIVDFVHPADLDTVRNFLAACIAQPDLDVAATFRFRHRFGTWVTLEWVGINRLSNPEVEGIIMSFRTIRRPGLGMAPPEGEGLLRGFLEGGPVPAVGLDREGRVDFVSPPLLALTGQTAESVLGARWATLFPLRHAQQVGPEGGQSLPEWPDSEERVFVTPSRLERAVAWSYVVRRDARGEFAGHWGIGEDLSAQRALEEQLRQAQRMELFTQLASEIAHSLNNMLALIQGHSDIIRSQAPATGLLPQNLSLIQKSLDRAAELVRRLMDLRKKESEPRVINLNAVVTEMDPLLRPLTGRAGKRIELLTHLDPNLGPVRADPVEVEQLILNLVFNARDAMPEGGQIIIETANTELDRAYARMHPDVRPGPYALLVVSDTGTGMSEEVQSRLFQEMFSTKEPGRGFGLGLSTVSSIVKKSNGHIKVFSIPGHGSTFRIYFPRLEGAAAPAEQPQAAGY